MQSFKLLLIFFVCFSPTIDATSSTGNESKRTIAQSGPKPGYKVLILGAGIAGITAAKTLHEAGITDFLVLEANKVRFGGRLLKKDVFPGQGGGVVELGANWVHGTNCNPIWDLVQEAKLDGVDTMIKPNEKGEGKYIILNEKIVDITKFVSHKEWKETETCLEERIEERKGQGEEDEDMRTALTNCNWPPQNKAPYEKAANQAIEYFCNDFDAAVAPEKVSSGVKLRSDGAIDSEDDEQFLISDRRGYETIISNMAEKFKVNNDNKIQLGYHVSGITRVQQGQNVLEKVEFTGKPPIQAEFVLVTFSIGVLRSDAITFSPTLPGNFKNSLKMMEMGNYLKIFVKFKTRFWSGEYDYIFYTSETKGRGYYPVWQNLPGTPTNIPENDSILLVTVTGVQADDLGQNIEKIKSELLLIIGKACNKSPEFLDDEYIGIELKNWKLDPLFRGAYANPIVGTTRVDFDTLTQPVPGRNLFFAGEGTSQLYYGFAHGAYLTGQEQAEKIITAIQRQRQVVNRMAMQKNLAVGLNYVVRKNIGKPGNYTKL